ncbi:MAE_28990/MAE_18760 family HEPN-like nuclease [Corallococcus aberystwythensis]|uniref:MAE_28990/MAE_18760 family HEPN-like nuclease n=1 Tax=Corallococcus aberystwythensis TaxID=2316722 RepID=UPI0011C3F5FF|nr:MAE_28990/MAE_18760 family HEPN-like nuclease [Corallococcus aberystwythensis]
MFSGLTARLESEVKELKGVLETHNLLRTLLYSGDGISTSSPQAANAPQEASSTSTASIHREDAVWKKLRDRQPSKAAWQVYDHCAAFTRLYALYEHFVIDLASEFLRKLPSLYSTYQELPASVRTQHRLGAGQIMLKLGKDGPYKEHNEERIIKLFSHGLSGQQGYSLLEDAFFIDPQNYRSEIIVKIFSYLGFDGCWTWVQNHPAIAQFMEKARDEHDTPERVLSDFIEYRNEAAHSSVDNIVALSDLLSAADFVVALGKALAELVSKQVVRRQIELGQLESIGTVIHNFKDTIVGSKMKPVVIAIGDSVVAVGKQTCCTVNIDAIHTGKVVHEKIQLAADQEIGLKLSRRIKKGTEIYRYRMS